MRGLIVQQSSIDDSDRHEPGNNAEHGTQYDKAKRVASDNMTTRLGRRRRLSSA